jgi:hypothetical protein
VFYLEFNCEEQNLIRELFFIIINLDVEPEPLDCDKPQSFENNFVHHMAIGETVVGTLWTSFAGVCIEKLLDELLKVCLHLFSISNLRLKNFLEWTQSEKIGFQRTSRNISNNYNSNNSNISSSNVEFK